jgi:TRAP-type C4-dicarboxylate transport system permease small subunit
MRAIRAWLHARAENIAVALLSVMFLAFIIQIVSRYVLNSPMGWTLELCLTMWLWVVFWGTAFCVRDREHVKFDIFYLAAPARLRRGFALVSALAIVVAMLAALPATLDFITFYKIKKSATLRIRLDYVFSIYAIFAGAIILRYAWRAVAFIRGADPADHDDVIQP